MFKFGLFGKKKAAVQAETPISCIQSMRNTIQMLEKKNQLLDKRSQEKYKEAQSFKKTNITRAKRCLMMKKQFIEQIGHNENKILLLEKQIQSIEDAELNKNVMLSMQNGKNILKEQQKMVDVDSIDDVFDDIQEVMDDGKRINEALASSLLTGDDIDVDEELNDMIAEEQEEELEQGQEKEQGLITPSQEELKNGSKIIKEDKSLKQLDLLMC